MSFTRAIDLPLNPYSWPYLILVRFLFLKKKYLEYLLTHYMETKSEKWLEHDYLFSATIFIYFTFLNSTNFKMCCFEYSVYSMSIHSIIPFVFIVFKPNLACKILFCIKPPSLKQSLFCLWSSYPIFIILFPYPSLHLIKPWLPELFYLCPLFISEIKEQKTYKTCLLHLVLFLWWMEY